MVEEMRIRSEFDDRAMGSRGKNGVAVPAGQLAVGDSLRIKTIAILLLEI